MLKRLPDRDIDPALRAILEQARNATEALDIPFFVGGAMARDITLTHVFGQEVKRATRDVDLGLYLDGWDRFQRLKNALVDTGLFHAVDGKPHRLHYGSPKGIPLDLIPFGRIEHPAGEIAWPPGNDVVLNVAGFEDAFRSALVVDLGGGAGHQDMCTSVPGCAQTDRMAGPSEIFQQRRHRSAVHRTELRRRRQHGSALRKGAGADGGRRLQP